jgi:carnosine synthase
MSEAGLPTPANFLIKEESQLEEAAKVVGFPAVLKPIHGAASLGVIRCDNYDDFIKVGPLVTSPHTCMCVCVDVCVH